MRDPWIVLAAARIGSLAGALAWARRMTPLDRVLVACAPDRVASTTAQLVQHPKVRLVIQPRDLGTAMELLHPLAHVLERDPLSHVLFVRSAHQVAWTEALANAIQTATYAIAPDQVTFLGASPLDGDPTRAPVIAAALVTTFWDRARLNLPTHARMLERYIASIGTPAEDLALAGVFAHLEPASFSRELLADAHTVAVVPLDRKALQLRVLSFARAA